MTNTIIRTYSELVKLPTFEDRFRYLKLHGVVGKETFGSDRYFNQRFYQGSKEWKELRNRIIVRDNACDLGIADRQLYNNIFIHHMNPIDLNDIVYVTEYLMNPEYLISTSFSTHNAIHYGNEDILEPTIIERTPWDTCPWKR